MLVEPAGGSPGQIFYALVTDTPVKTLQQRLHHSGEDPVFPVLLSAAKAVVGVKLM